MAFPRRFCLLLVFSTFALLSTYVFLSRGQYPLSIPTSLPDGWNDKFASKPTTGVKENTIPDKSPDIDWDENGFVKAPPVTGTKGDTKSNTANGDMKESDQLKEDIKESDGLKFTDKVAADIAKAFHNPRPKPKFKPKVQEIEELRVSILESGGTHEETTAALVHAFGKQKKARISLYQLEARYGIMDIIKEFNLTEPVVDYKSSLDFADSIKNSPPPQVLVSATCELDLIRLSTPFEALLAAGKTYLFCVVHHPDQWREGELVDKIRPWVQLQMVDFVGLSAHTAHYLRTEGVAQWEFNATVTVQSLPPVFPVNLPNNTHSADGTPIDMTDDLNFAMQGDADPAQNNYTDIFSSFDSVLTQARNITWGNETISREVSLHLLLGQTRAPAVPKNLMNHIIFDSDMTYKEYYTLLSRMFALVPYLAVPEFLTRVASPSVPAALISGTVLVTSNELLQAYSYYPQDAVWMQMRNEGEMDTVKRLVTWRTEEFERKKAIVRQRGARLVERNVELVEEWVAQGMRRVERAGWRMTSTELT